MSTLVRPSSVALLSVFALAGCAAASGPRIAGGPMWVDPDRHPFKGGSRVETPGLVWDGTHHSFFRPVSRFLAVNPGGEAVNVNALDEVPSSSWFTNRIGLSPMSPDEVAIGPCSRAPLDPDTTIEIIGAKFNGASPGFLVRGQNGLRYLMKFDDVYQGPRPTAADAIASRIYHAAGFTTPCNRVVFFERNRLELPAGLQFETWTGSKERLTWKHVDTLLTHAARLSDGRYRASVSQWLEGKALGPWAYEGTHRDDPNDVIPHEDRRELRGSRLLAAWLGHTDARTQNTLAAWVDAGNGYGWVRHNLVDFSDCFGSIWTPPETWRRMGHSYWFDAGHITEDFFTFGAVERPWDRARFGPSGPVFGYYSATDFDPAKWRMEYPNPAFSRMTEHDGAWMARIIARFDDEHLKRVIRTGRLDDAALDAELLSTLKARRDAILRRYLSRLSPLGLPTVADTAQGLAVCAHDLARATNSGISRGYEARLRDAGTVEDLIVDSDGAYVCARLPVRGAGRVVVVDMVVKPHDPETPVGTLRIHIDRSSVPSRVVAVERLDA